MSLTWYNGLKVFRKHAFEIGKFLTYKSWKGDDCGINFDPFICFTNHNTHAVFMCEKKLQNKILKGTTVRKGAVKAKVSQLV